MGTRTLSQPRPEAAAPNPTVFNMKGGPEGGEMLRVEATIPFAPFFNATVGVFLGTILTCYALAVKHGHVHWWLPEISDCFVYPPESHLSRVGVMGLAPLLALTYFAYYGYLKLFEARRGKRRAAAPPAEVSLVIGVTACFFLALVGGYDERTRLHSPAAVLMFSLGLFYCTFSSWTAIALGAAKHPRLRLAFCILGILDVAGASAVYLLGGPRVAIAASEWFGSLSLAFFTVMNGVDMDHHWVLGVAEKGGDEEARARGTAPSAEC